jgi:hypothetical protein
VLKRINVTGNDIKHGVKAACRACPVARAIWRHARRTYSAIGVFNLSVTFCQSDGTVQPRPLSHDVSVWIRRFDLGDDVAPFSFELDIPEPSCA